MRVTLSLIRRQRLCCRRKIRLLRCGEGIVAIAPGGRCGQTPLSWFRRPPPGGYVRKSTSLPLYSPFSPPFPSLLSVLFSLSSPLSSVLSRLSFLFLSPLFSLRSPFSPFLILSLDSLLPFLFSLVSFVSVPSVRFGARGEECCRKTKYSSLYGAGGRVGC